MPQKNSCGYKLPYWVKNLCSSLIQLLHLFDTTLNISLNDSDIKAETARSISIYVEMEVSCWRLNKTQSHQGYETTGSLFNTHIVCIIPEQTFQVIHLISSFSEHENEITHRFCSTFSSPIFLHFICLHLLFLKFTLSAARLTWSRAGIWAFICRTLDMVIPNLPLLR